MAPSLMSRSILRQHSTSRNLLFAFLCLTLFSPTTFALNFSVECRDRVYTILDGLPDPYGNLTEEDLYRNGWIYEGHVQNLDDDIRNNRSLYIAITLEGCKNLCHSPIEWYLTQNPPTQSFNIAANWILPILALVACLPFDSLHRRAPGSRWHDGRILTTVKAILNWLGSPPTSLTATLWNVYQIRQCSYLTFVPGGTHDQANPRLVHSKTTSYYILSCINQFEVPSDEAERDDFVRVLTYGLFKPLEIEPRGRQGSAGEEVARQAVLYTRELREALAFQLRMHRRRGTYPAGINICVFLGAFAISIGLAFADDLGEYTTAHSLALGLLVSWLPVLVMFCIVDRNPISGIRNRVLIQRWLWNVEAVQLWEDARRKDLLPNPEPDIDWWNPAKQRHRSDRQRSSYGRHQPNEIIHVISAFRLGDFIGQGRKMGYYGLTSAVLSSIYSPSGTPNSMPTIASLTARRLASTFHRPFAWWLCAFTSLSLVWLEITMALLVSYMTPTVGLSCRSGAYVCYGVLVSITWIVSCLSKSPNQAVRIFCHFFNALAVGVLGFIIFAQFTGILNNCACKCGVGGYMSFQDAAFYGKYFQVRKYWLIGALVGGLPPVVCFVVAGVWLRRLKGLWRASEQMEVSWELTEWRAEMGQAPAGAGTGTGQGAGRGVQEDEETRIEADMSWLT